MPHITYGLLKAIRSHQIDSLNVQTSLATGRPNACNLCHLDQTLAWTAEHLGQLLNDPYEAVRFIARRSLQGLPGQNVLGYDFVGPIKQRLAASQRVLQQWSGQVQSKPRAALLIDAEGRLNITLFEQLLRQRDDRPLRLAE